MSEETTIRLSQLARKLNVATTTIVAYLAEKKIYIDNKPNTRLTIEQYNLLAQEFADAALDKEEAAEVVIGQSYEHEQKVFNPIKVIKQEPFTPIEVEQPTQALPLHEENNGNVPINPISTIPLPLITQEQETSIQQQIIDIIPVELKNTTQAVEKITLATKEKFKGLTVLGQIDLGEKPIKKFQQVASSDIKQPKKKRPRKRITHASDLTVINKNKETGGRPPHKNKAITKPIESPKTLVSEKEIQEQIKSTLAKLGSSKGTTNRAKYRKVKRMNFTEEEAEKNLQADAAKKILQVTEFIAASDLATLMGISINKFLSTCMNLGILVSINQRLDAEAMTIIADEFDYQVEFTDVKGQEEGEEVSDPKDLIERAPIVTVMGHVDHGKTSLLDYIRNTQITQTEAGGITQHIGAYHVTTPNGKQIAFLDTPGHEAFTAMRARGARLTDIAIIVIAADDGVRPQTKEAINHAKLSGVPIIIAINKMDKPNANPNKVNEELAHLNILVEEWGGKYQSQGVSALTGAGVDQLLEKVLFEAELLELKANLYKKARGTVIEASLDQGRGYLATIMVQDGTLRVGNVVLAGTYYGKIKAMFNYQGKHQKEAGPSTPVQILGLNGAPQAGDTLTVMDAEKRAREIATHRQQILREQGLRTKSHITLDEIGRRLAIGNFKELSIIIKGDVDGSVEALADSLLQLPSKEIEVKIIHQGVGPIVDSDILLAATSDAIIIGFQVRPSMSARKLAEKEGIEIRLYSIIYDAINNIKDAMEGMRAPTIEETITGSAVIRAIFKINKIGLVAGSYLTEGYIKRSNPIRVIRDGIVIYTGTIKHLKHFKEDVQQVKSGFECGINVTNFHDLQVNDVIEGFEHKEIERKL